MSTNIPNKIMLERRFAMDDAEVFVYTEEGEAVAPDDVVRVRVDPSVTSIPYKEFDRRKKLAEVELCEGLVEIGEESFGWCARSIKKINIPISLRRINDHAFYASLRTPICLNDGIESIGKYAFAFCIFTNFRIPPLITAIPDNLLRGCRSIFSLELPNIITRINYGAFCNCFCLRNVAFPPDAVIGDNILFESRDDIFIVPGMDLQRLFGSELEAIRELSHRFDGLLIHSIVYYQSYNQEVLQNLAAIKLDATGNQQDCLGMTPLHILACSSVHNIEVYRIIVEKYPANLITEDRWGVLPLLYAFWGAAPAEIIEFLLDSYQCIYPGHVFNWTMMVETMGRCDTPKESIENLLRVKQMHFPEQPIDWEYLLGQFARPSQISLDEAPNQERMKFLVMCGMSMRVEALAFKVWRDYIKNMVHSVEFKWGKDNRPILHRIRAKIAHFEDELHKLKEMTTILELALWKMRINQTNNQENETRPRKKGKTDESSVRQHFRVTCGADAVIRHVLPYLLISAVNEESDLESDNDDDDDDETRAV
jgi:hypothetical protein